MPTEDDGVVTNLSPTAFESGYDRAPEAGFGGYAAAGASAGSATGADTEPSGADTGSADSSVEPPSIVGRVKWFDATRGFGFLVSDEVEGDVLLHFSVLRDHGRRSVPEGATVRCTTIRQQRGLQANRVLEIDLSSALPVLPKTSISSADRADRKALAGAAGEFELVEVKWFNRVRGYGFVNRSGDGGDVFVHMETVREAGLAELEPGASLRARIASSGKGLTAVEIRAIP